MLTIGLISDTHMPDRWTTLPPAVFDLFQGVDLILHAGDVGELWVLERLARVAPVIAVHGNDEPAEETVRTLPARQIVHAAERRILLMHGHHPDRDEEMRQRKDDAWHPKLARWADLGRQVGASVVIYGHTHIPLAASVDDVWVINPGAIASGSYLTRQRLQTVARLTLNGKDAPAVTYFDVNAPERPLTFPVDLEAGFRAALHRVSASLITPELEAQRRWVLEELYPLAPGPLLDVLRRLMFRCLAEEQAVYGADDVLAEIARTAGFPAEARQKLYARFGNPKG